MNELIFLLLIFLMINSCDKEKKNPFIVKYDDFELKFEGIDNINKKGKILVLNNRDTLIYNKGIGINKLVEKEPKIVYLMPMLDKEEEAIRLKEYDSLGFKVVRTRSYDLDRFKKQNVVYKLVGNRTVKMVFPRSEEGITGIYIDSLGKGSDGDVYGEMKINLYGKNLSKESRESFLNAVNTIKFNIE